MKKFTGENATQNLATEIKLPTIVFQSTKNKGSPMVQLAARPQTKNENCGFNFSIADAIVLAVNQLRAEKYSVLYILSANDGVS